MFENPGYKISKLAKIFFVVECIATIVAGIVLMSIDESFIVWGILVIIVGIFLEFIMCLFLCAFGELVESSSDTKLASEAILRYLQAQSSPVARPEKPTAAQSAPRPAAPAVAPVRSVPPVPPKQQEAPQQESPRQGTPSFADALGYALKFQTDDGLRRQLSKLAENAAYAEHRAALVEILETVPLSQQRNAAESLLSLCSDK